VTVFRETVGVNRSVSGWKSDVEDSNYLDTPLTTINLICKCQSSECTIYLYLCNAILTNPTQPNPNLSHPSLKKIMPSPDHPAKTQNMSLRKA
jgi:hypothetical protein